MGEHLLSTRPVDSRDLRVHFLQPFVASPGFEVGFWTRQRGGTPPPVQAAHSSGDSAPAQLAAAQREVQRLKEELEAERRKRSELKLIDEPKESVMLSIVSSASSGSDSDSGGGETRSTGSDGDTEESRSINSGSDS